MGDVKAVLFNLTRQVGRVPKSELVVGPDGCYHLPDRIHARVREYYDEGIRTCLRFPNLVPVLKAPGHDDDMHDPGIVSRRALSLMWLKVFRLWCMRWNATLEECLQEAAPTPLLIAGSYQVRKTVMDAFRTAMIDVLPSGMVHLLIVPNSLTQKEQVAKIKEYLTINGFPMRKVTPVASGKDFYEAFAVDCLTHLFVAQSNIHQLDAVYRPLSYLQRTVGGSYLCCVIVADEADKVIPRDDFVKYGQRIAALRGRPSPGFDQLAVPLNVYATATFVPVLLDMVERNEELHEEDLILLQGNSEYNSVMDYQTLKVDGEEIWAPDGEAREENFHLLFEEGRLWLDDLCSTPKGYGAAIGNPKVFVSNGIFHAAASIRNQYLEEELTVIAVTGGTAMRVEYFDGTSETPTRSKKPPDGETADVDWRALKPHLKRVVQKIGSRPLLALGNTAFLRALTLAIFDEDPDIRRALSHLTALLRHGASYEDCAQAMGRGAGYVKQLLLEVTGRDHVTSLFTKNDFLAVTRFPEFAKELQNRLRDNSLQRSLEMEWPVSCDFLTPARAGRRKSARPVGNRKFQWVPHVTAVDMESDALNEKAEARKIAQSEARQEAARHREEQRAASRTQILEDDERESGDPPLGDQSLTNDLHRAEEGFRDRVPVSTHGLGSCVSVRQLKDACSLSEIQVLASLPAAGVKLMTSVTIVSLDQLIPTTGFDAIADLRQSATSSQIARSLKQRFRSDAFPGLLETYRRSHLKRDWRGESTNIRAERVYYRPFVDDSVDGKMSFLVVQVQEDLCDELVRSALRERAVAWHVVDLPDSGNENRTNLRLDSIPILRVSYADAIHEN